MPTRKPSKLGEAVVGGDAVWFPVVDKLLNESGAVAVSMYEGSPMLFIPGRGGVLLHEYVKGMKPACKIVALPKAAQP